MSSNNSLLQTELKKLDLAHLDINRVFELALANGGALAECFFEISDSTRIFFESQKVDKITDGVDGGLGLRVIVDKRSIYGYTTDLTQTAIDRLASSIAEAVETNQKTKYQAPEWRLTEQKNNEIRSYKIKKSPRDLNLQEKIAYLEKADAVARKQMPECKQFTGVFIDSLRKIAVINSDGVISSDEKTYLQAVVQIVAEKDGRTETSFESDGGYVGIEFLENGKFEELAELAATRLKILLDASPAPAGTMPVVLSAEAGGTMIHEAVGHGLEADLACNGLSVYQGKIGEQVASELITVIDDGTMPEKRGSFQFDDEGTPSQKNVLIENGILKGYMVDKLSAMKFDMMATGNGRRETFRSMPIVRMTNTYIASGKDDPEQILKDTKYGVYVKAMGGGQVNTVNGDFVFAVTEGYLIRDGKISDPIRGATLVGNGPKVLKMIDRVGNDLGWKTGTCGKDGQGAPVTDAQPTLRIPELTVGGEVPVETYWKN